MLDIRKISRDIALGIYEDLNLDVKSGLIVTRPEVHDNIFTNICEITVAEDIFACHGNYDFILLDLLQVDDVNAMLQKSEFLLSKGGVLIMNTLGSKTVWEFKNSMLEADLLENKMITRFSPAITAEGIISIARRCFKSPVTMVDETKLQFESLSDFITYLREIKYHISLEDPVEYWQLVENIYREKYGLTASFEIICLFCFKH